MSEAFMNIYKTLANASPAIVTLTIMTLLIVIIVSRRTNVFIIIANTIAEILFETTGFELRNPMMLIMTVICIITTLIIGTLSIVYHEDIEDDPTFIIISNMPFVIFTMALLYVRNGDV